MGEDVTLAELREARMRAITKGEVPDAETFVRYVELLEQVIYEAGAGTVLEAIDHVADMVAEDHA